MDLGLIRYGDALQACRQLGALVEAQLLMPCLFGALLFGALNELSLQDRQRSNEKTPGKPAFLVQRAMEAVAG
ncbi:hypothetical protein LYZ86_18350 [Xanthomonas hortorum pv. cynarae]|uniref:hypothetical protein n=1 Tax=Xanthomonas hortorum TaxID=56454 RepID=UPI000D4D5C6C|nr:hypothetical protein [Xanthomonas hortorum]MCC4624876.1 hypothetical protein [Xanthomonas campestris pv. nigromaculans]MCE4351166.1 hypothetical protein [Xanthomonas hortorum pv. cynarae]PPU38334.1 hypothetical protein XcyCFBP4188_18675 [Xanthomonas hortorum pv. cynarae]